MLALLKKERKNKKDKDNTLPACQFVTLVVPSSILVVSLLLVAGALENELLAACKSKTKSSVHTH